MNESHEIECKVQDYYEVASADWILLEEPIDTDGRAVHRAIRSDQRIAIEDGCYVLKYIRNLYKTSVQFVKYEPDNTYQEDISRGYLGIKVLSEQLIPANKLNLGLSGVVTDCPADIDNKPELNFSVFYRNFESFSLQGLLSFVNHSCRPNCTYETPKDRDGVVFIRSLREVNEGEEITVSYGKNYFGKNREFCMCPFKEDHISKSLDTIISAPAKRTHSGNFFYS